MDHIFLKTSLVLEKIVLECENGYKGRIGIYEIFIVHHYIQDMLVDEQTSTREIRQKAHDKKFKSLLHDALDRVNRGITSLEEVEKHIHSQYINEITSMMMGGKYKVRYPL